MALDPGSGDLIPGPAKKASTSASTSRGNPPACKEKAMDEIRDSLFSPKLASPGRRKSQSELQGS